MIWRMLLRSWGRIRDLGLLTLLADHLLHGLGIWLALTAGIAIAGALTAAMATAAATHSKAVSTENRLNTLVGDVSNTNTLVAQLNQGIITNGQGTGNRIDIWGSGTLRTGPLSQFTDITNATFLSNLKKLNHLPGQPTDPNTGSSWATGERGYINNCVNYINSLDGDLQNKGYMN